MSKEKEKITNYISNKKKNERIFMPGLDGHLLSFNLFSELQHNNLKTEEIEEAYQNYKLSYENKRFQSFYIEHQNDEWFKEKYDPELNYKWRMERNAQCRKLQDCFISLLQQGSLNSLKLELKPSDECNKNIKIINYGINKDIAGSQSNEDYMTTIISNKDYQSNLQISYPPYFGFDPDKLTLFLHQIPKNISRFEILEIVKKLPGFLSMSMSEPIKNQDFVRYCWVTFDSEENTESAFDSLNNLMIEKDYKLNPIKSKSTTLKKIRVTPPMYEERITEDIDMSRNIVNILDKEKAIEQNNGIFENKERSKELQLDLQLLYLRRVHGYCYYCAEEYDDERMLATKCGNIHIRSYKKMGSRKQESQDQTKSEVEWEKNFVKLVKARIEKGAVVNNKIMDPSDDLVFHSKRNEYCRDNTQSISSEKYICIICNKMFKGENFVHNHIFNKHMNIIIDAVDKPFYEKLKFENYLKDKNKIIEKYRIIHNMDEYLQYINTIKNLHSYINNKTIQNEKNQNHQNNYKKSYSSHHSHHKKKNEKRDYRDLDDPDTTTNQNTRALISYDDL